MLPIPLGMILWCLANTAFLYYAIRKLEPETWKFTLIIWVSANDLYEQSVRQRELVEQSIAGEVTMRIVRRNEYGL